MKYLDFLYFSLNPQIRADVLRDAGLEKRVVLEHERGVRQYINDVSRHFRSDHKYLSYFDLRRFRDDLPMPLWYREFEYPLANAILRNIVLTDDDLAILVQEDSVRVPTMIQEPSKLIVTIGFDASHKDSSPFGHLLAGSCFMHQILALVATGCRPFGVVIPEPRLESLEFGSITYSIAGTTLLTAGVAIVIATTAGFAPIAAGVVGGSLLSSLGLIDLGLSWRKSLIEMEKAQTESELNNLRIVREQIELQRSEIALKSDISAFEERRIQSAIARPPAILIPKQRLDQEAELRNVPPEFVTHLFNKCAPYISRARALLGSISVK